MRWIASISALFVIAASVAASHAGPATPRREAAVKARAILDEALSTAEGLKDPGERIWALKVVADVWTLTDRRRAREAALEALEVAQSFTDEERRGSELEEVLQVLAKVDPQRALAASRDLTSETWRQRTLEAVIPALAETDPPRALEIVRRISDAEHQHETLMALIYALDRAQPEKAAKAALAILEMVRGQPVPTRARLGASGCASLRSVQPRRRWRRRTRRAHAKWPGKRWRLHRG